jgi:maleate isomerase
MADRILLGMLTPSSNTVLEPVTSAMIADLPEVSVHFSRFRVTEIALHDQALGQFQDQQLLEAAQLLADAQVDVIAWNGTSAGWLGFDADVHLCEQIQAATGIPATTSTLALNEIFQQKQIEKFALVTPYLAEVQNRIIKNYRQLGLECVAERHLNRQVNFSFSDVSEAEIVDMIRDVAATQPQSITTFCTNLRAAPLIDYLEAESNIPIYDTIAVAVWKSLKLAGVDVTRVKGWGRLFHEL